MEVFNASFDVVRIEVTESAAIGAIYSAGGWMVVGEDGRGLETLPIESTRPPRYLYIKGAVPLTGELGKSALDERTLSIVRELTAAFEAAGLEGVGIIDLTNKADIRLNWKNQIHHAAGQRFQS